MLQVMNATDDELFLVCGRTNTAGSASGRSILPRGGYTASR